MSKIAKYILIVFSAFIGLLLIVVGIIVATFNPNDYKPLIIKLVQEKKQRALAIPGDIKLTFFPRIGANLGKLSISEHKNAAEFASVNSAMVSLELLPLLSKRLVIDRVKIDGISANIRRFKDGTSNVDDLFSKGEPAQQIKFDIDHVSVSNAHILFDDQQMKRKIEIADFNLETGKIANRVPSKVTLTTRIKGSNPNIDASIALNSGLTIDVDQTYYTLKNVDAEIKGALFDYTDLIIKIAGNADLKPSNRQFALDGLSLMAHAKRAGQAIEATFDVPGFVITDTRVSGGKLNGTAKLTTGERTLTTNFLAASFEGSPQSFKIPSFALDVALKDAQLDTKAKISGMISGDIDKLLFMSPQLNLVLEGRQGENTMQGTLTTPFSANMKTENIDLSKIAAAFTLPNPAGGSLKLKAEGRTNLDLGKQTVSAILKGNLDQSTFDARLGLARFSPAAYTFDVTLDQIDVDRYQSKATAQASTTDKPIDLSPLKNLHASGSLKVGTLKMANIKASNVRLDLRAADGKVDINPLTANLYSGNVTGAVSATANPAPRFSVRQNFVGIDIGTLLHDAIDKQPIDGKGNVQLDVTTQGSTLSQLKKGLNGTARLALRDGAVRGINVAQIIRNAQTKINTIKGAAAPQTGTASNNEKTDFSELTGSFRIANGIARNDDLNVKSPLIRLGGLGDINLGEERLDYLVKATIVPTLQGQGGPELQALKGITLPVKLAGPFTAIGWQIDFAGMATELAQKKIDEKKEEAKIRAQEAIDKQKNQLQDQLKNTLKGLFGK